MLIKSLLSRMQYVVVGVRLLGLSFARGYDMMFCFLFLSTVDGYMM